MKRILGLVALMMFSQAGFAQTIGFEELPHDQELQGAGDTVLSGGFAFLYAPAPGEPFPTGFQIVGPSWRYNGRSAALNTNSCSATATLVAEDLGSFSLHAIDLAELNGNGPARIVFIGTTADHRAVVYRVALNRPGWSTFRFPPAFSNLMSVKWQQGDCLQVKPHMFDNVVVSKP